jgi:heme/copper-type cytochrome/quinol oxidase subunit 2
MASDLFLLVSRQHQLFSKEHAVFLELLQLTFFLFLFVCFTILIFVSKIITFFLSISDDFA